MRRALTLALRGEGWASPNPMVGAVIVKEGRVIGEGWHERCGALHAERHALAHCTEDPAGSTMYVTLEPCCHTGRQPPCTQAILDAGIRRVVVGSPDPNPLVAGHGVELLRQGGVEVVENVLREECDQVNEIFLHYIQTKTPFVAMKYAMTLDGKIACRTGASKWVTGETARTQVQQLRHHYRGILVGVGTVLADDPLLTCRLPGGRDPVRIVCDSTLRTPLTSQLVQTAGTTPTILATACTDPARIQPYQAAGCTVLPLPGTDGKVDLPALMQALAAREIDSILLEGGGTLNWAMLRAGLVQKVHAYIAPKLFGGAEAKTPVEGLGFAAPGEAVALTDTRITRLGEDFLVEGKVKADVYRHH